MDWVDQLFLAQGATFDPPKDPSSLWGLYRIRVPDGGHVDVEVRNSAVSLWPDWLDSGPKDGLSEVQALQSLLELLSQYSLAGITDIEIILKELESGKNRFNWLASCVRLLAMSATEPAFARLSRPNPR
ncbi:hypothetical protein N1028_08060 [Herbiconiux sp. CPCC 203407]|uniref:Uncharacterized protein n=1 Tax=Herbiconiux oxytropis TaxID=2970915 RepID=A0AA41XGJ8_9MICO|nr:hypothetical protein [Herbiconiux oxytropis]MCS5722890.1 hypothetical protein [Herbiconiux oxytropis]MCS5725850.1 hypothetical protein [Herbiconiux oxytropis]